MRNRVWIPLDLSVLCSFFVSRDLDRISSFDSSFSQGKSAETTFESNEQTRAQSMQSTADHDVVASYSNSASFLSLLAPGEFVTTSSSGGGTGTSSGTSMATPPVTGSIASIREAIPGVTADEIDNALGLTGVPVLDSRNGITAPRIQLEDAIVLLESTQPDPGDPADPPAAEGSGTNGGAASPSSSGGVAVGRRLRARWNRAIFRRGSGPSGKSDHASKQASIEGSSEDVESIKRPEFESP